MKIDAPEEDKTMMSEIPDEWWTGGYCSTFAAGLRRRFGGELWAIVNHSRRYNHDELCRCYCVIEGVAYDANGPHELAWASDTSVWQIPEIDRDCDVVIQWRMVDEDWLADVHEDFNPEDFPEVEAYIARHQHLFPTRTAPGVSGSHADQPGS